MDGGGVAHTAFADELRTWAVGVVKRTDCRQRSPEQRPAGCGSTCGCPRSKSGRVWLQWDAALDRTRLVERGWLDAARWYRPNGSHRWPLRDMLEIEAALTSARQEARRMIEAMADAKFDDGDPARAAYVRARLAEVG